MSTHKVEKRGEPLTWTDYRCWPDDVFAADEMLMLTTLDNLEVPLWEVFEVQGPRQGEALPAELG